MTGRGVENEKKCLYLCKFVIMAAELENTLRRISEKSRFLVERYRVLDAENRQKGARVAELEKALAERDKELEALKLQVEYLSVSSALAPDRDTLENTRSIIADLVREVDRCIADLSD